MAARISTVPASGESGMTLVDLIGVIGYYGLVSALLNVDRYPLAPGQKPELQALK